MYLPSDVLFTMRTWSCAIDFYPACSPPPILLVDPRRSPDGGP